MVVTLILHTQQPMHTMKVLDKIPNHRENTVDFAKFFWRTYKKTHRLAKQYFRIRKNKRDLLDVFIKHSVISGSVASVDSFSPALSHFVNVDQSFEHPYTWAFWHRVFEQHPVTYIGDILSLPTDVQYHNVINLGAHMFKYKNLQQCVEQILHMNKMTLPGGTITCCLPVLNLQFHRLNYNKEQFVDLLIDNLKQHGIEKKLVVFDNTMQFFYIAFSKQ